ncbi:MAG: hypothetical protein LBT83_03160 [Tannerella sp.]|jgi:hypothetical protein|nr:hypothetical protein [Tannerella sp.]
MRYGSVFPFPQAGIESQPFHVSDNGIKIILYMTLILSMLLMIYRRLNQWGYKTAKRRFGMELNDMILQLIVIFYGGNPDQFFKTG